MVSGRNRQLTTKKGYHVQITARSERDLTPEGIVQKVADSSGSKYTAGVSTTSASNPNPVLSPKPAFTPTRSNRGTGGFNPLASSRTYSSTPKDDQVDEDGWGQDAPQVTRTQLEKVQSSYQPTKVNMRELTAQKPEISKFNGSHQDEALEARDVVKGGYQPVGKVDIAALRRQAQDAEQFKDDRPTVVKGSYEPVGKVDIAAIRARAQKPSEETGPAPPPAQTFRSGRDSDQAERSAPFSSSERLTSLPKPKTGKGFGTGASAFTGTKAPTPGGFGLAPQKTPIAPPVGVGRTFADQGGKTPAQLWAERKARERGGSELNENSPQPRAVPPPSAIVKQKSGGGEWKSNYEGKTWAPVQTSRTGQSQGSINQQHTGEDDRPDGFTPPAGGVSAIRDRFKDASPMGGPYSGSGLPSTSPPPLDTSSKPNAGHAIPVPGLPIRPPLSNQKEEEEEEEQQEEQEEQEVPRLPTPPRQPPRSPTPPTPPALDHGSPIRIAQPVGRGHEPEINDAREEQFSPPPAMPTRSLAQVVPQEDDLPEEPSDRSLAHRASEATAAAAASSGADAAGSANLKAQESGKRALVQYDYEKAEDNELELKEGEYVINIEMVDEDWWMGQNMHGESGLFPSNYVELVDEPDDNGAHDDHQSRPTEAPRQGATATALYDYDAAESNELSFPENAKITDVVRTQYMIYLCQSTDHNR